MAARFALSGRQHLSRRQESDVEDGLRVPRDVLRQDDVAADLGADLVLPGGEGLGAGVGLLARDQLAQLALLALRVELLLLQGRLLAQAFLEGEVALGRLGLRLGFGLRLFRQRDFRRLLHLGLGFGLRFHHRRRRLRLLEHRLGRRRVPELDVDHRRRMALEAHADEQHGEQPEVHQRRERGGAAEGRMRRAAISKGAHCASFTCKPTRCTPCLRSSSITCSTASQRASLSPPTSTESSACLPRTSLIAAASSPRDTVRSLTMAPELSRLRTTRPRSALTNTSSGTTRGWPAFSTLGRSITAGVMSGAVTMKITSSTSITSTYGTMLISCIGPRLRSAGMGKSAPLPHGLPLEDVRELLHEALEAVAQAVDVMRVAVIGHDRRDGGEEADRGGDQRLGDAGRDLRERRLLHVRKAAERVHDAPHRAEEADVRADRAGRGEEGEMALEEVHLALKGGAHGAARAVHHVAHLGTGLAAQLGELAVARLEHPLERADAVAVVHRALVERVQVLAAPELALEAERLRDRAADDEP